MTHFTEEEGGQKWGRSRIGGAEKLLRNRGNSIHEWRITIPLFSFVRRMGGKVKTIERLVVIIILLLS
jgi:hypothetical protein